MVSEVRFKKLDSLTLEASENHLIGNFLRNGRVSVKIIAFEMTEGLVKSSWILILRGYNFVKSIFKIFQNITKKFFNFKE